MIPRDGEINALVADYRNAALTHGSATEAGNHRLANEAHAQISALYAQVRQVGEEAQQQLLTLLEDAEPAVRLWAAAHALEFAPTRGEPVLESLLEGETGPLKVSARLTLTEWRKGKLRFK